MRSIEFQPSIDPSDSKEAWVVGGGIMIPVEPFDPVHTQPKHFWVIPDGETPICLSIEHLGDGTLRQEGVAVEQPLDKL